jgi:dTDP-4-amino-4,6-dideoxygalactose transaminase
MMANEVISLPVHPQLKEEEIYYIINVIKNI